MRGHLQMSFVYMSDVQKKKKNPSLVDLSFPWQIWHFSLSPPPFIQPQLIIQHLSAHRWLSFYLPKQMYVCMSVCMYVNKWWWFLIEILPLILFILIFSTQTNRIKPFEAQFPVQNYYVKSGFPIPKHVIISIALHSIRKKNQIYVHVYCVNSYNTAIYSYWQVTLECSTLKM